MKKVLCDVYKSARVAELYLYVRQSEGLKRVPVELLERFGRPSRALPLMLSTDTRLARVEAAVLLEALELNGFYLQMPEPQDDYMSAINRHNSKLGLRP